jgi:hypothetical protein
MSGSAAPFGRCWISIALLLVFAAAPGFAQVNSWTKPTSGAWEEQAHWSLGVLPGSTQTVMFTNAGWKALAIGPNTVQNFPESTQVAGLRIESPPDSRNVLLLNFAGFQVPLRTTSLYVGTNSFVMVQSSALEAGRIDLSGTFHHGDFSRVSIPGQMHIGTHVFGSVSAYATNAAYYLTNGTLSIGTNLSMGGFYAPGQFVQYGGSLGVGSMSISIDGRLSVYGGEVTATNGVTVGTIGDWADLSWFVQDGGTVNADTAVNGHYTLNGGIITGRMSVPSGTDYHRRDASVAQNGGTNFAVSLHLGRPNRFGGRGSYSLSDGALRVDSDLTFLGGRISQSGGSAVIASNLVMTGTDVGLGIASADYLLLGGTLSVAGITAQGAEFHQVDGTNLVARDLVLIGVPRYQFSPPQSVNYQLDGGVLSVRNVVVNGRDYDGFRQTGGSNMIAEKLTLHGVLTGRFHYSLEGGSLAVKDILVGSGAAFQHAGGNIVHSGVLTLDQGHWAAAASDQILGPLRLTGSPSTNAAITFPEGASILRLAESSAQPWDSAARLHITNWHGSAAGGGQTRLYFGSSSTGLTPQQLSQIRFSLSGGLSAARILSTGEVVPEAVITHSLSGDTLTLTWGPGWVLESSINVAGPYQEVPGATSPYPVLLDQPSLFFRLRK